MLSFIEKELDLVSASTNIAPGPYGLPVIFFKKLWDLTKRYILAIINYFAIGIVDVLILKF
jgi:hypothetical protein